MNAREKEILVDDALALALSNSATVTMKFRAIYEALKVAKELISLARSEERKRTIEEMAALIKSKQSIGLDQYAVGWNEAVNFFTAILLSRAFGHGQHGGNGYGNGAILLDSIDDLIIEDEVTRKELLSAKRSGLKAQYDTHVKEMRELSNKMTKVDAELRSLEHTLP